LTTVKNSQQNKNIGKWLFQKLIHNKFFKVKQCTFSELSVRQKTLVDCSKGFSCIAMIEIKVAAIQNLLLGYSLIISQKGKNYRNTWHNFAS
jgi:hypothetical protein